MHEHLVDHHLEEQRGDQREELQEERGDEHFGADAAGLPNRALYAVRLEITPGRSLRQVRRVHEEHSELRLPAGFGLCEDGSELRSCGGGLDTQGLRRFLKRISGRDAAREPGLRRRQLKQILQHPLARHQDARELGKINAPGPPNPVDAALFACRWATLKMAMPNPCAARSSVQRRVGQERV
jgi:hypothetical protein